MAQRSHGPSAVISRTSTESSGCLLNLARFMWTRIMYRVPIPRVNTLLRKIDRRAQNALRAVCGHTFHVANRHRTRLAAICNRVNARKPHSASERAGVYCLGLLG